MKTKTILSLAIMLALPFGAMAENISGAMYNSPTAADTNHPAPTTGAGAPYGRVNIDTADQEHIATTAYVKGAYNSAIAAVNKMNDDKQGKFNIEGDTNSVISSEVLGGLTLPQIMQSVSLERELLFTDSNLDNMLVTATGVINGIAEAAGIVRDEVNEKRVTIYTTWNDDSASATTQVELSTAQ